MLSHQQRQTIFDEINWIKGRISQIKAQIDQIKGEVNRNWSGIRELREARRFHERESRRASSGFAYQGNHTDRGIADYERQNAELQLMKDALYQEMNKLHARKNELYEKLKS
jgi:hypothetical protein